MGSDDLFHKRKARATGTYLRKNPSIQGKQRVLIVCEGEKTEPNYLKGLRVALGLHPVNMVIDDKKNGLDPKRLVEHAIKRFNKDNSFDHVFCVFDKDKHLTYAAALDKIGATHLKGGAQLHAITSIPCFEIWILLHFAYTTGAFQAAADDSNCALVVRELHKEGRIPGYEKGAENVFDVVGDKLDTALLNAKRLEEFHRDIGTDNPSTKVYKLVEHLQGLKRQHP